MVLFRTNIFTKEPLKNHLFQECTVVPESIHEHMVMTCLQYIPLILQPVNCLLFEVTQLVRHHGLPFSANRSED
ncbi:hypothetical protein MHYP_G00344530 [Metynnis hypsauchen]